MSEPLPHTLQGALVKSSKFGWGAYMFLKYASEELASGTEAVDRAELRLAIDAVWKLLPVGLQEKVRAIRTAETQPKTSCVHPTGTLI